MTRAKPRQLGVVEICAGAGGQSLGLEQAGFEHLCAVEQDPNACNTLRHNRPSWTVREGDVTDPAVFDPADYVGADLFAGGVPCPPFSIAGQQLGAQDERDLYRFAVDLVSTIRPRALVLENVKGLAQRRFDGYREHVAMTLEDAGYVASWQLLRASDFGVPQLRPRLLLVALQKEYAPYFAWPEPSSDKAIGVGPALVDLMEADGWEGAAPWAAKANGVAPTIVGGSRLHGGADLGPTRTKRAWRKLGVDGNGIADAAPTQDDPLDHVPRLTNRMVARLQGWKDTDDWHITGKKTATYRQIGNAFPPPFARAVGTAIHSALMKETRTSQVVEGARTPCSAVYAALSAEAGNFLSLEYLTSVTGQTTAIVRAAIADLEKDFPVMTNALGDEPQFCLELAAP